MEGGRKEDVGGAKIFSAFFGIFAGFGLTKRKNGCIVYDIGLIKGRCSPQKRHVKLNRSAGCPAAGSEEKSKKLRILV